MVIDAEKTKKVEYRAGTSGARERASGSAVRRAPAERSSAARERLEPSRHAQRVSQAKREQRERRQRIMRYRRLAALILATGLVAMLAWGVVAVTRLPALAITRVEVTGNKHLDEATVRKLARVGVGSSIVWLPKRSIERRMRSHPWVNEVRVDRDFPDTVRIRVTERTPAIVVDNGGSSLWVVSADARWLGERSVAETGLPVVRDVEMSDPRPGARVDSAETLNALNVVAGLSDELLSMTRVISAPSIEKTALITHDDVEVFVGDATDIRMKDRIAREILRTQAGKVVYINVRVIDSPTWRGLDP